MYKKILLPVDNSGISEKAGEHAIQAAGLNNADIIVLHVIDTHYLNYLPQRDLRKKLIKHLQEERKEAIEKLQKKIEDEHCDGHCKNINLITMIKRGNPKDVILKTADELGVDHIIIVKSHKGILEKLLFGSTTERVVKEAKVPVNVIY
jgi:nucleotide-binding universal stress UspA family protein